MHFRRSLVGLLLLITCNATLYAQAGDDQASLDPGAAAARQLSSRDPLVRQQAAEELARLEATDQRRLIEGYRLQEKKDRVKLALDWALFRMGKREALYAIVRALDSSRDGQARSYLNTLESPEPLYNFLEQVNGNTQIQLLRVLGRIGDPDTIERIKAFSNSFDPEIVKAANEAIDEINQRGGDSTPPASRPRRAESSEASP